MKYEYIPSGVCSKKIEFVINEDDTIDSIEVTGGCNGNLKGIAALCKGRKKDEVISLLDGIKCGFKNTSCPDQIAQALKKIN
ncbi:MAG: TIGR03905 family TSCPD domain-containing protein [Bacilli bacterium]|nr:TIGR03905 family TSCPD domain-containing protein [Bacilli bacterium]